MGPYKQQALILLAGAVTLVNAHVSLTFPPARDLNLDFLDTFRTVTPCGMYRGDKSTLVEAGAPLTITWHLGYPHRGGFKLELLDNKDKKIRDLTPSSPEFIGTRQDQSFVLDVPSDLVCPDCTIRLVRKALEWGPKYMFQSCANVDVVARFDYTNKCSGNGKPKSGGTCDCNPTYFGDQCQYKNDCDSHADCGGESKGKCISHGGSALPAKECYCKPGFFGQNCQKISILKETKLNASAGYEEIKLLGDDFKFLWRYIGGDEDEVEGVIIAETDSFVAIGWRPNDITKSCQKFPTHVPAPKSSDFVAMDCQDIVVGKVKGDLSNIGDYYTRDRSTPRRDKVYGGVDDLTAAIGWEVDGTTTVMFRKPVTGSRDSGKADHDFNGLLKLIWAYGQSGQEFYKADELKYHGGNRGYISLQIGNGPLSQERVLMIIAIALLGFIIIFQAIHKLACDGPCSKKREENDMILGTMK